MKNLEHSIRDLLHGKQEVNEELLEAKNLLEEFQKEYIDNLFEEYDDLSEEEYNKISDEFLQIFENELVKNYGAGKYETLKSFIPGYEAYKSLKKGKYGEAAKEAGIDLALIALGATGIGAVGASALKAARVAHKLAKAKKYVKAAKTISTPLGKGLSAGAKSIKPGAKAIGYGALGTAVADVAYPGLVTKSKTPDQTKPKEVTADSKEKSQPSSSGTETRKDISMPGTLPNGEIDKALKQLAGGGAQKDKSFKYQNQDFTKKKGKWVPSNTEPPEQPKAQAVTPAPEQPKAQAVTPAPEQPKPESRKKERWSDVRKRLGFSARQSVTSDPKLLAAYNAYKEGQPIASETEYNQELIEGIGAAAGEIGKKLLSKGSKFGKNTIEKLKKLFKGGAKKSGGAARLAGAALTSALLSRLLGGQRGYDHTGQGDQELSTLHSSDIKLHQAGVKEEYILIPEAVEPSDESRKNIEFVPRPNNKRKETEYVGRKKGKKRIDDALGRQASIKSLDV